MTRFERGDDVTVTTETINGGDPFSGEVISIDKQTETVGVEAKNLDVVELAIVGFSEVEVR